MKSERFLRFFCPLKCWCLKKIIIIIKSKDIVKMIHLKRIVQFLTQVFFWWTDLEFGAHKYWSTNIETWIYVCFLKHKYWAPIQWSVDCVLHTKEWWSVHHTLRYRNSTRIEKTVLVSYRYRNWPILRIFGIGSGWILKRWYRDTHTLRLLYFFN